MLKYSLAATNAAMAILPAGGPRTVSGQSR